MYQSTSINVGLTGRFSSMVETAKREGLWFYGKSCGLEFWLSPVEFEKKLFEGGEWIAKINWLLQSPKVRLSELKFLYEETKEEFNDIVRKVNEEKTLIGNKI